MGDNVKHDEYWITKKAYRFRKGSIYGSECGHSKKGGGAYCIHFTQASVQFFP